MKHLLLLFVLTFSVNALAQFEKTTHPTTYTGGQMIVGLIEKGVAKEYLLLADGGVYRHSGSKNEYEKLGNQTKENIKIAFGSLDKIKFQSISFQYPGKINSKYIIFKKGKTQHKTIWGDAAHPTPADLTKVYKAFMGMIPVNMRF